MSSQHPQKQHPQKKVLVLAGDGLNCEVETHAACKAVGLDGEIVHLNDLIADQVTQERLEATYGAVIIPGGFSFGDEWGSGRVLSLKIKDQLGWDLKAYAARGGWVLGICNGFQAMIRLGVFGRTLSITHNSEGEFQNRWAHLRVKAAAGWLEGISEMHLPIRHGEGRLVMGSESEHPLEPGVKLALQYVEDMNGSWNHAAALSCEGGKILGMMPHPEAALRGYHVPGWTIDPSKAFAPGPGMKLFENLSRHLNGDASRTTGE